MDPNCFSDDEELRKTVESLQGAFIITMQEKPLGGGGTLRQDLFKKVATAEGVSARPPYGKTTRLISINGLNRVEHSFAQENMRDRVFHYNVQWVW